MDETFELLTLMQTGKTEVHPVVLLEAPGGTYWRDWLDFIDQNLLSRGLISATDVHLIYYTHDITEAVSEITRFYRNYHSQRYVDRTLVLRMLRIPPEDKLAELGTAFADILRSPELRVADPSPQEIADNDALEDKRLALDFRQNDFGRLRQLIDELNAF